MELTARLKKAEAALERLLSQYDAGKAIREGLNTVIAGRPNVGKSTLMNLLSGCERSIVTELPGTTRDVVEETVLVGDVTLRLSDTAGIRSTEDLVEQIGVNRAKDRVQTADLVLAVFDASQELNEDDRNLLDSLQGVPSIAVINKTDLDTKIDVKYIKNKVKQIVFLVASEGKAWRNCSRHWRSLPEPVNWSLLRGFWLQSASSRRRRRPWPV